MKPGAVCLALSSFFACCLVASCGDGGDWHLAAAKKGNTVQLCLSNGEQCPQPGGVSPSSITVYRWDNMHDNVLVWDVEPTNPIDAGKISGLITWGVAPERWAMHMIAPALVCGKAYLVNPGAHYFALKCDGSVVVFDAPKLEEFFRENKSATPVKGDPSKGTMGPE